MLVLARQKDEAIMIGNSIEIKVVEIKGGKVRLGISAPSDIPVHRKEIFDEITNKNLQAAASDLTDIEIPLNKNKISLKRL